MIDLPSAMILVLLFGTMIGLVVFGIMIHRKEE